MFSGIIYSTGIVKNVKKNTLNYPGSISLEIKSKLNIKKKTSRGPFVVTVCVSLLKK